MYVKIAVARNTISKKIETAIAKRALMVLICISDSYFLNSTVGQKGKDRKRIKMDSNLLFRGSDDITIIKRSSTPFEVMLNIVGFTKEQIRQWVAQLIVMLPPVFKKPLLLMAPNKR